METEQENNNQITKDVEQTLNVEADSSGFLNGGIEELQNVIDLLSKRDEQSQKLQEVSNEGSKLENAIKTETTKCQDEIQETLRNSLLEATSYEDKEIDKQNDELKKQRTRREKAKNKGVNERIDIETKDLVNENKELHRTIRKTLRENGLPAYCDSNWFYLMFCTQNAVEWCIKIAIILCSLIVIPTIILELIDPWWFWKMLWWIVIIVIEVGLYWTVYLLSKDKDNGTLEDMRDNRDLIRDNQKKIMQIKREIKKDPDESSYNLGEFDVRIHELKQSLESLNQDRDKKLADFENNTKPSIVSQINEKYNMSIENMRKDVECKVSECNKIRQTVEEIDRNLQQNYEGYLTKNNMNIVQINKLIEVIKNGQAENIQAALNMLK